MEIKTFEDACKALGIEPTLPEASGFPEKHRAALIAHYKLILIAQALNGGWEPNWKNNNEYKYYPWFEMDKPGFGFSGTHCDSWYTRTAVGSRLCFKTRALAEYAGKQFIELYKEYFTI